MARVPFIDEGERQDLAELIGQIKAGRGKLLNMYKVLLHSPGVTRAWMALIDAIRNETVLDGRWREIAILRVAAQNASAYEIRQHIPRIAKAEGLTPEDCDAIAKWPARSHLGDKEQAVIAYADEVTRDVRVSDAVFDKVKLHFSTPEIVELTVIIGIYNMHGRVVDPLQIDLEPGEPK